MQASLRLLSISSSHLSKHCLPAYEAPDPYPFPLARDSIQASAAWQPLESFIFVGLLYVHNEIFYTVNLFMSIYSLDWPQNLKGYTGKFLPPLHSHAHKAL